MFSSNSSKSSTQETSSATAIEDTLGFPNGHLGHLKAAQETSLQEFKQALIDEDLYVPASPPSSSATALEKPQRASHTDAVLLRFLRARSFQVQDAVKQFRETERWRKANDIDGVYANIDVEAYDESRRYYTHSVGRRDKRGLPLYLFRIAVLDSAAMATYAKSSATLQIPGHDNAAAVAKDRVPNRLLRLFGIYENLAGWMTELCTALTDRPNPEVPITQGSNIVDVSGVTLRQFWNLRVHMQDASELASSHYPETLDRVFIVGAPSYFPTVWSWIKRWFDPVTVSKMFILSDAQVLPTLSQFIDPANIPRQYGGSLDFTFGDTPTIDPAYADRLTWANDGASGVRDAAGELRRWPTGPVSWAEREDGDWDLVAVGSVDGTPRREVVARLAFEEKRGGWADSAVVQKGSDGA